jgi:purine-binding chemotaxis protein CheW
MTLDIFNHQDHYDNEASVHKVVNFRVGDINCAVNIMHVSEIILPIHITSLPNSPGFILGVADHRESAIPVVDLRKRLGVSEKDSENRKWIIANVMEKRVAIVVDSVKGVTTVHQDQERDRFSLNESSDVSWAKKVYGSEDGLIFEIDLNSISQVALDEQTDEQ